MVKMLMFNFVDGKGLNDKRNGMINDIDDAVLTCT